MYFAFLSWIFYLLYFFFQILFFFTLVLTRKACHIVCVCDNYTFESQFCWLLTSHKSFGFKELQYRVSGVPLEGRDWCFRGSSPSWLFIRSSGVTAHSQGLSSVREEAEEKQTVIDNEGDYWSVKCDQNRLWDTGHSCTPGTDKTGWVGWTPP